LVSAAASGTVLQEFELFRVHPRSSTQDRWSPVCAARSEIGWRSGASPAAHAGGRGGGDV